ncbi:hypothetical protein BCT45_17150 [Vibrio breoganii]|nr:hypothetical protein BCT45_17150 [Vibrio breoganii]
MLLMPLFTVVGCSSVNPECEIATQNAMQEAPGVYREIGVGNTFEDAKSRALEKLSLRRETVIYHELNTREEQQSNSPTRHSYVQRTEMTSQSAFRNPHIESYSCSSSEKMVLATVDTRSLEKRLGQYAIVKPSFSAWFKASDWRIYAQDRNFYIYDEELSLPLYRDDLLEVLSSPSPKISLNGKSVWYGQHGETHSIDSNGKSRYQTLVKITQSGGFNVLYADQKKQRVNYTEEKIFKIHEKHVPLLFVLVEHDEPIGRFLPESGLSLSMTQQQTATVNFMKQWQVSNWTLSTVRYEPAI